MKKKWWILIIAIILLQLITYLFFIISNVFLSPELPKELLIQEKACKKQSDEMVELIKGIKTDKISCEENSYACAIARKNASFCAVFPDPSCEYAIEFGETFFEEKKADCEGVAIINWAVESQNSEVCKYMGPKENEEQCRNNFYATMAMQDKDISKCEDVAGEEFKKDCKNVLNFLLAMENKDNMFCDKILQDEIKQSCHSQLKMLA